MDQELHSSPAVRAVAERLVEAESVLTITGAGISADSGLPTYRGIGGVYSDDGITGEGLAIEDLLSGPMFERRPELVWKYLLDLESQFRGARPNRGHDVLAQLEARLPRAWILTQNVDGLHTRAGSRQVLEIHGNLHHLRCTACSWRRQVESYAGLEPLPRCPDCHGIVRPDVVLFGEILPEPVVHALQTELVRGFDLVISVGTSSLFPYITLPVIEAHARGIPTAEINPGETELSHLVDHRIRARAAEALDAIWQALPVPRAARKSWWERWQGR